MTTRRGKIGQMDVEEAEVEEGEEDLVEDLVEVVSKEDQEDLQKVPEIWTLHCTLVVLARMSE